MLNAEHTVIHWCTCDVKAGRFWPCLIWLSEKKNHNYSWLDAHAYDCDLAGKKEVYAKTHLCALASPDGPPPHVP